MKRSTVTVALLSLLLGTLLPTTSNSEARKESDVVYGVLSGLSLVMDVYHPPVPLRRGVVLIPGSGWDGRERGYTDWQLKNGDSYINPLRDALVDSGFTVFVPNTRMAPEHRFPAPVDDVRRAVRFIRFHAARFGIEPDPIGAVGHSTGGHLAAMAGVLDDDPDLQQSRLPEEHASSRVQAVVTIASPHDLTVNTALLWAFTVSFLGERAPMDESFTEYKREGIYAEASTVTHVTPDDAAFMLIHGTGDANVTFKQLPIMADAVRGAGLPLKVVEIESDSHAPPLNHSEIADWIKGQLGE